MDDTTDEGAKTDEEKTAAVDSEAEAEEPEEDADMVGETTMRINKEDLPLELIPELSAELVLETTVDSPDFPLVPRTVEETGLREGFVRDLALKHLYLGGELEAITLVERMALDFRVIDDVLGKLKKLELVVTHGGTGVLRGAGLRYRVTERGRKQAEESLQRHNYCGPAPVPFEQYVSQQGRQRVRSSRITPERVKQAFSKLVLPPRLLERLGPALNSGQSLFLYGPPGNGKTSLAECILDALGGHAFIPHAVLYESEVVRVFDELYHTTEELDELFDRRWVYSKRPVVVAGGELTLEDLDLTRRPDASWYQAPLQVKANSGVLFIDDFGRQRVHPQQLLNRWIVPLESGYDYVTFRSGQKARVPFDNLVVFATNLEPRSLTDEAFLRRIRYKLEIPDPTVDDFKQIWIQVCEQHGIAYDEALVDHVLETHYRKPNRPLRSCHPRDLLEQYVDNARYRGERPPLTPELLDQLCEQYFVPTP